MAESNIFLYSAEICDKWGQELIISMYIAINVNVYTFIYSKINKSILAGVWCGDGERRLAYFPCCWHSSVIAYPSWRLGNKTR